MALVLFLLNIDGYEDCLAHILKNPFVELIHMISRGAVWDLILLQGVNGDTVSGETCDGGVTSTHFLPNIVMTPTLNSHLRSRDR